MLTGNGTSPETATARDAFEAWATTDHRAIQPLECEQRTDDNDHYYESDYDNNAFVGWKAAAGDGRTPTVPSVNFCQWLKGYFSSITGRDELTAFEANTIRSELYEKVFPSTPIPSTDREDRC